MSGAKHLRLRYYTSLEEAMLVRVWREHMHEISSYTENLPIFREIADGLQKHGIRLNKQEVRRRINSYRNKYLNERSRIESNPQYKSEWRLYALVHSLFQPTNPSADINEAHNVLEAAAARARADLPALPPMVVTTATQLKFERDPDGSAFLDAMPCYISPPVVKTELSSEPFNLVKTETKPTQAELTSAAALYSVPRTTEDTLRRAPLAPANYQLPDLPLTAKINGLPDADRLLAKRRRGRRSILPRNGQITMAQVEQLRKENQMLQEQNEASLLELEQKQKHFLALQQTIQGYLEHQENMLSQIMRQALKHEPGAGY
ncbi:hypothetical protein KR054_003010 [Drosophila jambulina]|nr:hypothetical protein KR054_003010 [Drosophila jambulina]